ncbi:hypothetical protein [Paenibacillus piri]|uniref:Glycoside hydrolase family 5 domain-containing protein n=1 Tax=Paenibacillus piri TaxID=2547395 RepID=A0A4R5KAK7_9BACL|nr:hypothetical protein [Paenibacillus piri]TDF91137.1 hypothetical protein E1757_33440 [Paenibacillus piri]
MSVTKIGIQGEKFLVNGKLTYSEIEGSKPSSHGLLMNARFIQGIFDDKAAPERFARFGQSVYNADKNTDDLIAALPEWYNYGLRAFTVGLQGGGPVFTIEDWTSVHNNPFSADGLTFDPAYEQRLDKLIRAADEIGMVVIVSLFYWSQAIQFRDGLAIRNAVKTACGILKKNKYTNVIIEVANEFDISLWKRLPHIQQPQSMSYLLELARESSGGMPVGSSLGGGAINQEVAEASDVILIHANNQTRQEYYNMIKKVRSWGLGKPIVCNEDSPCIGMMEVAFQTETSWGYYNNLTKQEPPAFWGVTKGEDEFFARRIAEGVGIELPPLPVDDHYYLQGFEPLITIENKRWIRLASLYPETVNYVEFYRNGILIDTAYNEPFMIQNETTWIQQPWIMTSEDKEWTAKVFLADGRIIERSVKL